MKNKRQLLEIALVFTISLIFSLIYHELTNDDVWNYGFAYNISNGLIPYRDFNMVTTPLYPLIDSIFLTIFGRNIVIHFIVNAIVCTIIFLFMKKNYPKCYYLIFSILLIFSSPNYNLICLLFLYVIQHLESNNKNDYLIGIVLGLIFLTKQSIGIYLCIPTLFTKDIKKILKRIIGFVIPNILILIYLVYNNALYDFIDYCFLGIGEFSQKNFIIFPSSLFPLVAGLSYLIWQYIRTKDYKILYLICFFGMSYPIIDPYHTMIPAIPTIGYFLNSLNLNKKIINISFILFIIFMSGYNIFIQGKDYTFPNETNSFKYCKIDNNSVNYINTITDYVEKGDKNTFIIDSIGYVVKLELGIDIGKYDFFLTGNVGKNGSYRLTKQFDEICKNEKCTFIVNNNSYISDEYTQYNKFIHQYVIENYKKEGDLLALTIYNNH